VGHTTDFTKRKNQHKTDCNNPNRKSYNIKLYTTIRENGGWSNWSVVLVENYPCNNGTEARMRERFFYELYNADLNMNRPIITDEENKDKLKEYMTQYREENKEKIKEYMTQYREENKEKIKGYRTDTADKLKENGKQYREENKEKIKQYREENKEKIKQYREENKEKIKQYREENKEKFKQYCEENKEKIKQYCEENKEKHICECGGKYTTINKTRHFKTNKHQIFIETNEATL
jgi:hypothetical protein